MKGVELPINVLVVVAIAVIVLLGLAAFYLLGTGPFQQSLMRNQAWNDGCRVITGSCNAYQNTSDLSRISVTFDVGNDASSTNDNMLGLCKEMGKDRGYDVTGNNDAKVAKSCRVACGCAS